MRRLRVRGCLYFVCFFISIFHLSLQITKDHYLKQRAQIIDKARFSQTGGKLTLNYREQLANATLMKWKLAEISQARTSNEIFLPSVNFMLAKKDIEKSKVFQLIKQMPKGALLHVHSPSQGDVRWLIKNVTYDSRCYTCIDKDGVQLFHFFEKPPSKAEKCRYMSVEIMRNMSANSTQFDEQLFRNMTLWVDDPDAAYPTIEIVWKRFLSLFVTMNSLLSYAPAFDAYSSHALESFVGDNIQYVEMRIVLQPLYELNGVEHDTYRLTDRYHDLQKKFSEQRNADFFGANLILTTSRSLNRTLVADVIKRVAKLRQQQPDFILGFDLVGYEEPGHKLIDLLDELLAPIQSGIDLPYFFHAGETDWKDEGVDLNILDAILLNTTRIGHGYAITKHPYIMELTRQKNIPLSVCPVSNQILHLVKDLRNHPASELMSQDFPVVIASDDPAFYDSGGASYDFYEAFMGLGGTWSDLATLKQLAINSINYSSLSKARKSQLMTMWQRKWDDFITTILGGDV